MSRFGVLVEEDEAGEGLSVEIKSLDFEKDKSSSPFANAWPVRHFVRMSALFSFDLTYSGSTNFFSTRSKT